MSRWKRRGGGGGGASPVPVPVLTPLWPGVTHAWALNGDGSPRAGASSLSMQSAIRPIPSLSRPYPAKSMQWPGRGAGGAGQYTAQDVTIHLDSFPLDMTWTCKFSWKPSVYASIEPATATILISIADQPYVNAVVWYVSDAGHLGYYQSDGFAAEMAATVVEGKPYMATLQRTAGGAVRLGLNNAYQSFANEILQPASSNLQFLNVGCARTVGYPWFSAIEDVVMSPTRLSDSDLAATVSTAMANTL